MQKINFTFEMNNFIYKSTSFDKKEMVLYANKHEKDDSFIKKVQLRMGEIPKSVKKKLNPLK
ncbi:MAG: hypothetical protein U9Q33_10455 [Campylobacterota bacterium]|nr:hypothetical protein [Campylobacterota bacterium]